MSHSRLRHFQKHRLFWRMNTLLVLLLPSVLLAEEAPISTPLLDAIYDNDTAEVLTLLEAGADPHETNRFQAQPLQYACLNGNLDILEALLEAGARPDSMGEGRIRPLMLAAKNGHPALVRALLEAGVDPTHRDGEGQTAILFACHEGHLEAVQLLHQAGADPFDRIAKGKFDGFLLAARNGHTQVVAYLLNEAEGDPNRGIEVGGDGRAPKKGTSIMRLAMENGHFDTAALLLQAGADPR
ncbi:MAG: ankyrin repeat domain-containing protein, partial [Verrucomicrobiota bacterium]